MNLYVANLHYGVSEQELKQLFEEFGAVISCKIVLDRNTQKSRGFGFVEFENGTDAQSAISGLDGKMVRGRALKVSSARAKA
jgi:RNA recognition motif-containing protein